MIRAQVIVRPRASIFDPQGAAVGRAIRHLGVSTLKQAHVGKFIELELEGDNVEEARDKLEAICKDLLSNPVIEDYVLTIDGKEDLTGLAASAAKLAKKSAPKAKKEKA